MASLTVPFRPSDIPTGLQGYWKFDNNPNDSSANGYNLTANAGPTYTTATNYWKDAYRTNLVRVSGQYFSITSASAPNLGLTGTYSMSAWIKVNSISANYNEIISKRVAATSGFIIRVDTSGIIKVYHAADSEQLSIPGAIVANKWHNLVIVYDTTANTICGYVDGNLVGSAASTVDPTTNSADFWVGATASGDYFDGSLSDVAVWNVALTPIQVKSLAMGVDYSTYAYRPDDVSTQPTHWWKLNEVASARIDYLGGFVGTTLQGGTDESPDVVDYTKITATRSGSVDSIFVDANAAGNVKVALYSDNAGEPGTKLTSGSGAVVSGQWNKIAVTPYTITSGTSYWLAAITDTSGGYSYTADTIIPRRNKTSVTYSSFSFPTTYDGTGYTSTNVGYFGLAASSGLMLADNNTVLSSGGYVEGVGADFELSNAEFLSTTSVNDFKYGAGNFTQRARVKFETAFTSPIVQTFMSQYVDGSNHATFYLIYSGGVYSLGFYHYIGAVLEVTVGGAIPDIAAGVWYDAVVKREGNDYSVWWDGVKVGSAQDSSTLTDLAGTFFVGQLGLPSAEYYFDGIMEDAATWKGYALTDQEIRNLATSLPIQQQGIVSYWKLNDTDLAKTVTANGNATQLPIKLNKSAGFFNGTTDYVTVPDSTDWDFGTGDFTIECFVNVATVATTHFVRFFGIGTNFSYNANTLRFGTLAETYITGAWTPTANTWYHIAVKRLSGNIYLYVDGAQVGATTANTDNITGTSYLNVGAYALATYMLVGWMKELRISNVARTVTVPTVEYTPDANTVLLMHFDTPATTPLAPAIAFDGTGDYLFVNNTPDFQVGTGEYTVEAWINYNTVSGSQYPFTVGNVGENCVSLGSSAGVWYPLPNGTGVGTFVANKWYHVAISRSGTNSRFFVDGQLLQTIVTSLNINEVAGVFLGQNGTSGAYFNGLMREFRFSNIARYTSAFTPSQSGFTVDANTKLYIKGNEANGAVSFVDSETVAKQVFTNGDAKIKYTEDYRSCVFKDDAINILNADIDNEDMSVITDWTDADSGTGDSSQVTFDSKSCMKLDSGGSAGASNYAYRYKDTGSMSSQVAVSINLYCAETSGVNNHLTFAFYNGSYGFGMIFNGTSVKYLNGSAVLVDISVTHAEDVWEEWTVEIDYSTGRGNIYQNGVKVVSNALMAWASTIVNGRVDFLQYGTNSANRISYIDWLKVGSPTKYPYPVGAAKVDFVAAIGNGVGYFNAVGDVAYVANNSDLDFGTGDFTWEFYTRQFANPNTVAISWLGKNTATGYTLYWNTTLRVYYPGSAIDFTTTGDPTINYTTHSLNTWMHIAITRSGNSLRAFVNGKLLDVAKDVTGISFNGNATNFCIGGESISAQTAKALMDGIRISKGIARYKTTFTPPSSTPATDSYTKLLLTMEGTGTTFTDTSRTYSTWRDAIGSNHMLSNGVPVSTTGEVNLGASTVWGSSALSLNYNSSLNITSDMCVFGWYKYTNNFSGHYEYFLDRSGNLVNNGYTTYLTDSHYPVFWIAGNATTGSSPLTINTWYFVTGNYDGATKSIIINSVVAASSAWTTNPSDTTSPLNFPIMTGVSDEVGLAKRYFRPEEVKAVYLKGLNKKEVTSDVFQPGSAPAVVPSTLAIPCRPSDFTTGLVGYWKFDGNALDSTPANYQYPNDLTPMNNPTFPVGDYWKTGEQSVYLLDASTQWLKTTNSSSPNLYMSGNTMSCSAWIKCIDFPSTRPILAVYDNTDYQYAMYVAIGGYLVFQVKNTSGTSVQTTSAAGAISAGKWHHVAGVYNGTRNICYIDGNLASSDAQTGILRQYFAANFEVGSIIGGTVRFNGSIKDVAVWNVALTPLQIKSLALGVTL